MMNEIMLKEMIEILEGSKIAFKERDGKVLSEMSDKATDTAGLFQEPDTISLAVMVYALSKVLERNEINQAKWWQEFMKFTLKDLETAFTKLKNQEYDAYREVVKNILFHIHKTDKKIPTYIERVIREAKIKRGSKFSEQGISLERAADLLGLTLWEMRTFVGKTRVGEEDVSEKMLKKIELVRGLFK